MQFVAERILPAYVRALEEALDATLERLPAGRLRAAVLRLRRRLTRDETSHRFGALHRLATLGEIQGWIAPEEAIVIRKLAYRVAFYSRRAEGAWRTGGPRD